jgi:glycosyltransferase involved in cell wall biosynthesis
MKRIDLNTLMQLTSGPTLLRVLTRLGAGGPPIHAVLLTRAMTARGYESALVTGQCGAQDGDMSYLLSPGDTVHWVPEMSRAVLPGKDARALWRLFRLMKKLRPTIVHTHTAKAGVLGRIAARLAGVPVVVHTFHGNVLSGYFPEPVSRMIRLIERILAYFTDAVCVLSPQQAVELVERFKIAGRSKVHIIRLGMDLEPFRRLECPSPGRNSLTVGWLGRLVEVKNVPLLLAAVEETLRRTGSVRFLVAGDGPEREAMKEASKRFGDKGFEWLGWIRDVAPVMAQCNVLLQTSRNEGTPVALIQGMAAGRPFVSTAAGGVVDMASGPIIRQSEGSRWFANGVLTDAEPSAIAGVLCELAGAPQLVSSMGRHAQSFALTNYNLGALVDRLDRLYSALIARKAEQGALRPSVFWSHRVHPSGAPRGN